MAEEGPVIACHTIESWNECLQKSINEHKLMVVDFTATWCGPCRFMAPVLAEIAKKFPHVLFVKVDVDELKTVAQEWRVEAMPTFIFVKDGKQIDTIVGANKEGLLNTVAKHGAVVATETVAASASV